MKLLTYVKDANGMAAGRSQYYEERQADYLIKRGVCVDASNGDHIGPSERDLFLQRVDAFRQEVSALYTYPTVTELEPRVRRLPAMYKELAAEGDWPHRPHDLRSIHLQTDRLERLITQAKDRETLIARWEEGGILRQQKVMKLNADMQRAQGLLLSPNAHEQQLGEALRKGVEQKFIEMDMLVANLKAQLKAITG
jgi:hypothetical protein